MYVDQRALRVDRVTLLERGAPHSVCLCESGKILPDVKLVIVHPDTRVPCAHTDLGEVCGWSETIYPIRTVVQKS